MKKDVLVVEFQEVFDAVACRIVYQNDKILKRGEFEDDDIKVFSAYTPDFSMGKLFIKGLEIEHDNHVFLVSEGEAKIIKEKVKAINEKYGRKERWRAEVNEHYWYIDSYCEVEKTAEWFANIDNRLYQNGNYFKTQEQAEEACRRVKIVLKQYQEELLKEE